LGFGLSSPAEEERANISVMPRKSAKPEAELECERDARQPLEQESFVTAPARSAKGKMTPKKRRKSKSRLAEMERRGEAVTEEPTHFGPLPVIRLIKPTHLGRIIKLAKS